MWKKPSAWIPIAMSAAALSILVGYVALFGIARQADEGTAAHLFQLLMVSQVPVIGYFAIRWLPGQPVRAAAVLAAQVAAAIVPMALLYYLEF